MIHPETIDIEEYLDAKDIAWSPSGSKNVGKDSIGISCPFCGDHTHSGDNHLGIRLDNMKLEDRVTDLEKIIGGRR